MRELLDEFRRELAFFVRQPFQNGRLLPRGNSHELVRLALQLAFVRMNDEKLCSKMPDAAANLPRHQGILIGRIVANDQHGFRLVQLLHGEQGEGRAVAERREQSGVIGGSVMIDVVGSKGPAGESLQEIVFFV